MWFEFLCIRRYYSLYSSVPNRRAGQNKHAGGKILKKNIKCAGQNRGAGGKTFWKINNRAGGIEKTQNTACGLNLSYFTKV